MRDFDFNAAEAVIERIADMAEAIGEQHGVSAMEIAGALVSYLAEHPRDIEPCLKFGVFELPQDWLHMGCLTWTAQNGKIVRPEDARRAAMIKRMEKGDHPHA